VRFLVDNALSPAVANALKEKGFDALHVQNVGLGSASDHVILEFAFRNEQIIILPIRTSELF